MSTKKIDLGDVAKDTITGFEGVVVAQSKWLHGCVRMTLQPRELKEGKPLDHPSRIRAGLEHMLEEARGHGHCFVPAGKLIAMSFLTLVADDGSCS